MSWRPRREHLVWAGLGVAGLGTAAAFVLSWPDLAEWSGALTVALSFGLLFTGDSTPEKLLGDELPGGLEEIGAELDEFGNPVKPDDPQRAIEQLWSRVELLEEREGDLRNALTLAAQSARLERRALAVCSVAGTLLWAFGSTVVAAILGT